jgi:hypothetical protein
MRIRENLSAKFVARLSIRKKICIVIIKPSIKRGRTSSVWNVENHLKRNMVLSSTWKIMALHLNSHSSVTFVAN